MTSLLTKVEKAFTEILKVKLPQNLFHIYEGHSNTTRQLPCLVVYCDSADEEVPDSPIYRVRMQVGVMTQQDDENVSVHAVRIDEVTNALADRDEIITTINFGNPSRPVPDLHIFDYWLEKGEEAREDRHFAMMVSFVVIAQGIDEL